MNLLGYLKDVVSDEPTPPCTTEEIANKLKRMSLPTSILRATQYVGESKEGKVQKNILNQLRKKYGRDNVTAEYNIGGHWGMWSDIDLFDGTVGIELKVAEQLTKAANVERLIGQTVYYTRRKYTTGNLIVVIVGRRKEYDAAMKELQTIITEIGAIFIYKSIDQL